MRLVWLCCVALGAAAQESRYYAPQTFAQLGAGRSMFQAADSPWASTQRMTDIAGPHYGSALFRSAGGAAGGAPAQPAWRASGPLDLDSYSGYRGAGAEKRAEPWRAPAPLNKEQQAAILHHKQSLSSEGAFRFEYASDNGLAAGEVIEPDGSRVGAYQYKDPGGRLVSLKYRAGKDGFQILEGSHLPKSPEPVAPPAQDGAYAAAYEQQRRQFALQQQHDRQPGAWRQEGGAGRGASSGAEGGGAAGVGAGGVDDGQYRENDIDDQSRGPHSFGEGYAFAFKG